MLAERPHQIVGFHESFAYERGGTSDMLMKGLLTRTPTWLIPGDDLKGGFTPSLELYPQRRKSRELADLKSAGLVPA